VGVSKERAALDRLAKAARDPHITDMLLRFPVVQHDAELAGLEELREALKQADSILRDNQPDFPDPHEP
jgi:hypothetical protein